MVEINGPSAAHSAGQNDLYSERRPPVLSVVVPCYNEEEVLPETVHRLKSLLDHLIAEEKIGSDSHVIFVNDGSHDATWRLIKEFNVSDPRMRGISLSANRGHQIALVAGLFAANGDAVVSIDADLQDDVSAIERMVDAYRHGAEIVYGVRRHRERDTYFKRSTAEAYYRILKMLGVNVVFNHADFRLLGRRALESLKEYSEVNLFIRGLIPLVGFRTALVEYDRSERFAGEPKYTLKKMFGLAMDGVTSFTVTPLRLISVLGIAIFVASMAMAGWVFWIKLFTTAAVPGWASTVIPMYCLGGVQLLSVGVLGEYVAKTYLESKRRPRYFIEEAL